MQRKYCPIENITNNWRFSNYVYCFDDNKVYRQSDDNRYFEIKPTKAGNVKMVDIYEKVHYISLESIKWMLESPLYSSKSKQLK